MPDTALLPIDVQQAFTARTASGVPRSNPGAVAASAALQVHHDDPDPASHFRQDRPGGQPLPCAAPLAGDLVFVKSASSGFSGTGLADHLIAQGITRLIVAGGAIDVCVSSTECRAADLGMAVDLVQDAVFGFGTRGPDGVAHDPPSPTIRRSCCR